MITPMFCKSDDNIDDLHKYLMQSIVSSGKDLKFGDKDEVKMAREGCFIIQVYGKGIDRLLDGKVPDGVPFKKSMVKRLQQAFLDLETNPNNFVYTYQQLLKEWPLTGFLLDIIERGLHGGVGQIYDQMQMAKRALENDVRDNICSNRNVGTTLHPYMNDVFDGIEMKDKPCFNWFQVRYNGNKKVSLRLLFRSHDYIHGIWPNLCSIVKVFYELVVKPCGCDIEEVILISTSGHAYETDSEEAEHASGMKWEREQTHMPNVQG